MATIHKYPMSQETTFISMPKGAKILDLQVQDGTPTIWALVDDEAELEKRNFQTVGTGWPLNDAIRGFPHIGTVQIDGLVWHIFEVIMTCTKCDTILDLGTPPKSGLCLACEERR